MTVERVQGKGGGGERVGDELKGGGGERVGDELMNDEVASSVSSSSIEIN